MPLKDAVGAQAGDSINAIGRHAQFFEKALDAHLKFKNTYQHTGMITLHD